MKSKYLLIFTFNNKERGINFLHSLFKRPIGKTSFDTLFVYSTDQVDEEFLSELKRYSNVLVRPNEGRDYGAFWTAFNKFNDYERYGFLHDDLVFVMDNWLDKIDSGFNLHQSIDIVSPQVSVNLIGELIPRGSLWFANGTFLNKIDWPRPEVSEHAYDQEMNLLPKQMMKFDSGIAQVGTGTNIMYPDNYGPSHPETEFKQTQFKIMASQTRIECGEAVKQFSQVINTNLPEERKLLYVGIAGDPEGGEYSPLFNKFKVQTFDADPVWKPEIVGDITNCPEIEDGSYGAIVCVQVIEHVKELWNVPKEMHRILCNGGYAIVDCPFNYPYHAEPPSFGDYWRITKDGMEALFGSLFQIEGIVATNNLTSCLLKKI